jgi:hypothetical protein
MPMTALKRTPVGMARRAAAAAAAGLLQTVIHLVPAEKGETADA